MTIKELLEAARRLPDEERKRLVSALQDAEIDEPSELQRSDALSAWIGLAGTFHSGFSDVSSDKSRHLADIYGDAR